MMIVAHMQMAKAVNANADGIVRIKKVVFAKNKMRHYFVAIQVSLDQFYVTLRVVKRGKLKVLGGDYSMMTEDHSIDGVCGPAITQVDCIFRRDDVACL